MQKVRLFNFTWVFTNLYFKTERADFESNLIISRKDTLVVFFVSLFVRIGKFRFANHYFAISRFVANSLPVARQSKSIHLKQWRTWLFEMVSAPTFWLFLHQAWIQGVFSGSNLEPGGRQKFQGFIKTKNKTSFL